MSAPGRFRVLPDYEAYLKFGGREPRTLEELAIARANLEHQRRLATIKTLRAKLALLEQFLPALAERGIRLAERSLASWDSGKTMRIESRASCSGDNKLYDALIELGFREIERSHLYRDEHTVKLQHGRWLVVAFVIKVAPVEAAA